MVMKLCKFIACMALKQCVKIIRNVTDFLEEELWIKVHTFCCGISNVNLEGNVVTMVPCLTSPRH